MIPHEFASVDSTIIVAMSMDADHTFMLKQKNMVSLLLLLVNY